MGLALRHRGAHTEKWKLGQHEAKMQRFCSNIMRNATARHKTLHFNPDFRAEIIMVCDVPSVTFCGRIEVTV